MSDILRLQRTGHNFILTTILIIISIIPFPWCSTLIHYTVNLYILKLAHKYHNGLHLIKMRVAGWLYNWNSVKLFRFLSQILSPPTHCSTSDEFPSSSNNTTLNGPISVHSLERKPCVTQFLEFFPSWLDHLRPCIFSHYWMRQRNIENWFEADRVCSPCLVLISLLFLYDSTFLMFTKCTERTNDPPEHT